MPYSSEAQRRYFHAAESRGDIPHKTVKEFDKASKGMHLPEKKMADGGEVCPHCGRPMADGGEVVPEGDLGQKPEAELPEMDLPGIYRGEGNDAQPEADEESEEDRKKRFADALRRRSRGS